MMKLLICNYLKIEARQLDRLRALGFEVVEVPGEKDPAIAQHFDAEVVVGYMVFRHFPIEHFTSLKLIHTSSAGVEHLPHEYIREHGIGLYNAGGVFSAPIAEFVLGGVLQLYKFAPLFARQRQEKIWKQRQKQRELRDKRVCIVGAGSIGGECAWRFKALGCRVTGLRRHPAEDGRYDEVLGMDKLEEVLSGSDIVIVTTPLTEETYHLFNAERFAAMKEGAVFCNVARGRICDERALLDALDSGRLSGAVLDVCETEPLPAQSPLWERENVLLTPHTSFLGEFITERMADLLCKNLSAWLKEQGAEN